jgi:hypothetical protein
MHHGLARLITLVSRQAKDLHCGVGVIAVSIVDRQTDTPWIKLAATLSLGLVEQSLVGRRFLRCTQRQCRPL